MKNVESEDDFKKLLDLYLKGRLSASEKTEIEERLDAFKKKDPTPLEFNQQHADDLWKKIAVKTIDKKEHNRGRFWLSIAAAIVFTSVAAILVLSWNHDRDAIANKVILKDGTIVWLKRGATLDHSQLTITDRQVKLSGEALFEVARMPDHPFIIHCGRYDARVLGTSFNIRSNDSTVELTVLTGTVKLSSIKTDTSVLVNAREHVVFTANNIIQKTESNPEEVKSVIANTQYDMHFEDTRMIDIVRKVERKFDVHVNLKNDDIGNCMISADFTDQSLPITLEMISEALGFRYEIVGNEVNITGTGCQD